jgi:predicted GIY-YIG superfamily endonuclease
MDIKDVIGRYVRLTRSGGIYRGRCPFHKDDPGMLTVIAGKDYYECRTCGRCGDAGDFVIGMRLKRSARRSRAERASYDKRRGFVYVLELVTGHYYVGFTQNLKRRICQHFEGRGSCWTKEYAPVRLLEVYKNVPFTMENKVTEDYLRRYGWQLVRGGEYVTMLGEWYKRAAIEKYRRQAAGAF